MHIALETSDKPVDDIPPRHTPVVSHHDTASVVRRFFRHPLIATIIVLVVIGAATAAVLTIGTGKTWTALSDYTKLPK